MRSRVSMRQVLILLLLISLNNGAGGQEPVPPARGSATAAGSPDYALVNRNTISAAEHKAGMGISTGSSPGFIYPRGSGKGLYGFSGIVWCARLGGELRAAGSPYGGLLCGKLLNDSVAESPDLAKNRIYRVRPDIPPGSAGVNISPELQDNEGSAEQILTRYTQDWNEWPWLDGAPYEDRDGDQRYDPKVDIPGVKGADQTVWCVANDFNPKLNMSVYGSTTVGIELQTTVWAYSRSGGLGSMIFKRFLILNKSRRSLDSMYVGLQFQAEIGDGLDDFAGCDTTRDLGYAYNGNEKDRIYSPLPPPATGFVLLQGPLISGAVNDIGRLLGRDVRGKRNLRLTAFTTGVYGTSVRTNDDAYPLSLLQWSYALQGRGTRSGAPRIDPHTKLPSALMLAGDPVRRTGWIDGQLLPPGDRCPLMGSGPFTMAPGDTQEILVAQIAAGAFEGCDRLAAVDLLKHYADQAHTDYRNGFAIPPAPPPPEVDASPLDREIVLSWGSDCSAVGATEGYRSGAHRFQGYTVYQLGSAAPSLENAQRLATFDVIDGVGKIIAREFDAASGIVADRAVQFGTDSGIRRHVRITADAFRNDLPLLNGSAYHFAVTAYSYDPTPNASPVSMESPPRVLTVIPHVPDPGSRYGGSYGDTIASILQTAAPGYPPADGSVRVSIVDPLKLNGHRYVVAFDSTADSVQWRLRDATAGTDRLTGQRNNAEAAGLVDGLLVTVRDAPAAGVRSCTTLVGTRRWSWVNGNALSMEGYGGAIGLAMLNRPRFRFPPCAPLHRARNVLFRFAATDSLGAVLDPMDPHASLAHRYLRNADSLPRQPGFAPFIVNPARGFAYQDYVCRVPFAAYDAEASPPRRLMVGFSENNVAAGLVDGRYWPPRENAGVSNTDLNGPAEMLYVFDLDYAETASPLLQVDIGSVRTPMLWWLTVTRASGAANAAGDQFLIQARHLNSPGTSFAFTAPASTKGDMALARTDVQKITVFPNPYYGANPQESNKYHRFVTFSHLPSRAVIRIFTMAGVMVRRIDRTSSSQFEQWDLLNDHGYAVGSGLYLAHIEMPEIGATKVLKIAVIQEQQILDRF